MGSALAFSGSSSHGNLLRPNESQSPQRQKFFSAVVSNLGWGPEATHTKIQVGMQPAPLACKPHEPYRFPLQHPRQLARCETLERELDSVRLYFWNKEPSEQ